jgi:branched-chain amino acid transport system substrate-binding protein
MKIGILYPRSKAHPGMMVDFVDGIKLAVKQYQLNNEVELITESIGFGGNEKEVYEKVEKVLTLEGADIIVAYIDQRVVSLIEPLLHASGKLMIVVNPGANYPENWIPQPNIIYLTLQHSFLCWLTGVKAAKNNATGAAVATSFFDCGYLHVAAITNGFINNGGNILHNHVNKSLYNDTFEIKALTDYLDAEKETDNLLCVFDTSPAALFYERLNNYEESKRLHLYVSPMMLEEPAWKANGDGFNFLIEGHLPYHAAATDAANAEFRNVFTANTKREPSLFALQGWEIATVIKEIVNNCKENYTEGSSVAAHLATTVINSPRGELKLDKETHFFIAPAYKGIINNNTEELLVTPAESVQDEWKKFVANPVTGPSSGWTNTYLCY